MIDKEARDLLGSLRDKDSGSKRLAVAIGAIMGGFVGVILGFVLLLMVFGLLGGGGQAGLGAIFIGIPLGGWVGAEIGSRVARRRS